MLMYIYFLVYICLYTYTCTFMYINIYICTYEKSMSYMYVIYGHVCVYLCTVQSVHVSYIVKYVHMFSVVQAFQNGPSENDQQGVGHWESGYVDNLVIDINEGNWNYGSYTWHLLPRVFSLRLLQHHLLHVLTCACSCLTRSMDCFTVFNT